MMRFILLLILLPVSTAVWSASLPLPLPQTIYFSDNWCPRKEDLTELSKHLEITMNGCCIRVAQVLPKTFSHPETIAPWAHRIIDGFPSASCNGIVLTVEEEKAKEIEEEKMAKDRAEQNRIDEASRRSEAPSILKAMNKEKFCVTYGKALRKGEVYEIGTLPDTMKLVKQESNRRKLRFDDSLVRVEKIRIGISECQLYASWGLPRDQNQSVGRWGVHIQHVYSYGTYVYTENGRVTSWQD